MKRDELTLYVGGLMRVEFSSWTVEGLLERSNYGTFSVDDFIFTPGMVRSVTPLKQNTD